MAHTYTSLYYHLVFGTKHRRPVLRTDIQGDLWAYLGGIANENEIIPLAVGGYVEHAHLLVRTRPTLTVSRMMQFLKGGSSWWIHRTFADLQDFQWQDGYGAFSISKSDVERVRHYIENQAEHHRKKSFHNEYLEFLKEYDIPFDPRFVWD